MATEETILLTQATQEGETRVNIRVIDLIAGLATKEVEGVAKLRGTFGERAKEVLGKKVQHSKGIYTKQNETGDIAIEAYVELNYGVSVPKVAHAIQEHIKSQIHAMMDLEIASVDVHVTDIISEKTTTEIDPNNLFGEQSEEGATK
ncbi:Asp23/Gls24 family envelope stress response protein [Weissella diestrammenae]|uniref:Asp23/Gls24 family envelope stress response protein n=1 Tax=Weissella diestrammenae TaxID=1162633 RepID=A0A7G9T6D2_9LACO|nr:Asp23/Gls24 family envelope stress response protein [Weissella diestrammenae]MCM0583296.1 Asp23/Gls24 family envelope stress response protein [Weissella diestrammenae]QNN75657.1 Asp23/Gls24 family envelope stress response protein [Weissella diestrammenae]